jgi:hypothetical protein
MSALLGTAQFIGGAVVPPIVTGVLGPVVALPLLILGASATALLLVMRGVRPERVKGTGVVLDGSADAGRT